jgi:hypothetical protein
MFQEVYPHRRRDPLAGHVCINCVPTALQLCTVCIPTSLKEQMDFRNLETVAIVVHTCINIQVL